MSPKVQLLLLAGLLVPCLAQAQVTRPRMGLIRPRIERLQVRQHVLQQRIHGARQLRLQRDLLRQRVLDRFELRYRIGPEFRGPAFRRFTLPRRPGLLWRRHFIRI